MNHLHSSHHRNNCSALFPASPFLLRFYFALRHRYRPLAVFRVFIILIITLIISPTVPEVQYLYVSDVLYSIKAVC